MNNPMNEEQKADLERITKELDGHLHEMSVLDSNGIEKRRVTITYPVNK